MKLGNRITKRIIRIKVFLNISNQVRDWFSTKRISIGNIKKINPKHRTC